MTRLILVSFRVFVGFGALDLFVIFLLEYDEVEERYFR